MGDRPRPGPDATGAVADALGGLKLSRREGLWAAVQALWMDEGFTAMMVTHDLREALYLADVVYVMGGRPGQVIERQMVDLPRPRVLNEEFDAACLHQLHALRAAVARAQPEMMMSAQ